MLKIKSLIFPNFLTFYSEQISLRGNLLTSRPSHCRGGGYFGLRSYGDVPTFRVDFLTQNILDRVQIWVSTKCWAKKYFRLGRKLGFGHELLRKNSFEQGDFLFISKYSLNIAWNLKNSHRRNILVLEVELNIELGSGNLPATRILVLECPQENERVIVTEDLSD